MNKYILPLLSLATLLFFASCSDKFKVAAPYKNITVVNAFLDAKDTAHYIRIQKAFLDENKNAINMAKEPDSNFYANLDVSIKKIDYYGNLAGTIHLTKVDLNTEGYPKESGIFFNSPNYAYKFKGALNENYIYRLMITNTATGNIDSAESPIINDVDTTKFFVDILRDENKHREGFDFASTLPNQYVSFGGTYVPANDFIFNGATTPAYLVQAIIRFKWNDSDMISLKRDPHEQFADYDLGYSVIYSNQFYYKIPDINMYAALIQTMKAAPAHTARLIGRCVVYVYMGTKDFNTYREISLSKGLGLTGNDIQPVYTNIMGNNVLGLFTSKGFDSGYVNITKNTIDSLITSKLTSSLRIAGASY